jgi:hypothetical protein
LRSGTIARDSQLRQPFGELRFVISVERIDVEAHTAGAAMEYESKCASTLSGPMLCALTFDKRTLSGRR